MGHINDLPQELICYILSDELCDIHDIWPFDERAHSCSLLPRLRSAPLVCTRWKEIIESHGEFYSIGIRLAAGYMEFSSQYSGVAQYFGWLEEAPSAGLDITLTPDRSPPEDMMDNVHQVERLVNLLILNRWRWRTLRLYVIGVPVLDSVQLRAKPLYYSLINNQIHSEFPILGRLIALYMEELFTRSIRLSSIRLCLAPKLRIFKSRGTCLTPEASSIYRDTEDLAIEEAGDPKEMENVINRVPLMKNLRSFAWRSWARELTSPASFSFSFGEGSASLERLEMHFDAEFAWNGKQTSKFPMLKELSIRNVRFDGLKELFGHCTFPSLRRLQLDDVHERILGEKFLVPAPTAFCNSFEVELDEISGQVALTLANCFAPWVVKLTIHSGRYQPLQIPQWYFETGIFTHLTELLLWETSFQTHIKLLSGSSFPRLLTLACGYQEDDESWRGEEVEPCDVPALQRLTLPDHRPGTGAAIFNMLSPSLASLNSLSLSSGLSPLGYPNEEWQQFCHKYVEQLSRITDLNIKVSRLSWGANSKVHLEAFAGVIRLSLNLMGAHCSSLIYAFGSRTNHLGR